MRAALLQSIPGRLEIVDDVDLGPVGPRDVVVRVVAAGLCHSDLHFMHGSYACPLPAVLGHESAGVVEAIGTDVTHVRPGDHVITCISGFCGQCRWCLQGRPNLCDHVAITPPVGAPVRLTRNDRPVFQFMGLSSFAECVLVHENYCVKIRPDMPLERAALLGCAVTTGVGAVLNTARVRPGETVAVLGCGGIGLNAIQAAVIAGAARVIAVDTLADKLRLATQFGATDTVDASQTDAVAAVVELTGGGVDHAFEAIGLKQTAEQAFAMLTRGGTATVIGMVPLGQKVEIDGFQLLMEKRIQGSNMGSNRFRLDMPQYVEWYLAGKLKLDELVSDTLPFSEINAGFDALATGAVARQIVTMA